MFQVVSISGTEQIQVQAGDVIGFHSATGLNVPLYKETENDVHNYTSCITNNDLGIAYRFSAFSNDSSLPDGTVLTMAYASGSSRTIATIFPIIKTGTVCIEDAQTNIIL